IGTITNKFLSFTMVLGIAFLLLVSLVISAGVSALNQFTTDLFPGAEALFQVINLVVSFGVITLLFAAIYKVLPDKDIAWNEVCIGAAFTAFLFTLGKFLLGWYLGRSSFGSTDGAAGAFVLILVWIYYAS